MFTVNAVDEFHRFADDLPIFVWTQKPGGEIDWANRTWYEYVKLPKDAATTADGWAQVIHPDDLHVVIAAFGQAIERHSTYEIEHRLKPSDADETAYRWVLSRSTPRLNERGEIAYWLGTGIDIHDARMRASDRAALLAELTEKEAHSFQTIADNVPQMMWSARADGRIDWYNRRWYEYTGQTADEAAGSDWRAVSHPDDLAQYIERWPDSVATGQPFESEFRLRASAGTYRMFLNRATPVRDAAGDILRWYGTSTDIEFEYNLRMRERRIAQTFQNAALQVQMPNVTGLTFDAIYEPAQADALVGGDWFDAFRLIDGRVVFSVGDVAGSGLKAAVTMGSLRQSIRTATLINPDPVAVLDAVDRIVRDMSPDLFATAFIAVFDPVHGELRYASAGHPPPLLRRSDGTVIALNHSALPLGLRQRNFEISPCLNIDQGMLLMLYTDGLTEFDRDPVDGERKLIAALGALTDTHNPARALFAAVVAGDGPHDDIAILTVLFHDDFKRRDGTHGVWSWSFDATDPQAARNSRNAFADVLKAGGMSDSDVISAELVFAELVGNVFRYASRNVRVALDRTGDNPVLHVLDEGGGFEHNPRLPNDMLAEHGRGLYIVSHLTQELSITRRLVGGSHMRAVLTDNTHPT